MYATINIRGEPGVLGRVNNCALVYLEGLKLGQVNMQYLILW